MKKLIQIFIFLFFSCNQSKINSEMREGLMFNYKTINSQEEISENDIIELKTDSITNFTFKFKGYGCSTYLGGYYQENDTLYLCFQNMNPDSHKLKCVDFYKMNYKIENGFLNY